MPDAMVADLLARGQVPALHAIFETPTAANVPPEVWERFLAAEP